MSPRRALAALLLAGCSATPDDLAIEAARRAVLERLLAPSTASFGNLRVSRAAGCWVHGWVDSQNAHGAMLRQSISVEVRETAGRAEAVFVRIGNQT